MSETITEGLVLNPNPPTNSNGVEIVEVNLRKGVTGSSNFTIVTPDFSERTTWYQKSIEVLNETLTTEDNLIYSAVNPWWINMGHRKLTIDYKKVLERDGSLTAETKRKVTVKVDDVAVTTGFTIDYRLGKVTFESDPGGIVKASYWHNNGVTNASEFLLIPPPSYLYRVNHIESQFSKNTDFTVPIRVEVWAGAISGGTTVNLAGYGGFIDAYFDAGYGQSRSRYRTINDLINWCNNAYPTIEACGDLENDVMCFPFHYVVHPEINAKQGTLIRLINEGDGELVAEISTIAFYMEKLPA